MRLSVWPDHAALLSFFDADLIFQAGIRRTSGNGPFGAEGPLLPSYTRSMSIPYKLYHTITTLLSGLLFLISPARSLAESPELITLTASNVPLTKVLQAIEQQTGYYAVYHREMLQHVRKMNVQVKDVPLQQLLDSCFYRQPLSYRIVDKLIILIKDSTAALHWPARAKNDIISIRINHQSPRGGNAVAQETSLPAFSHALKGASSLQWQQLNFRTFWAAMPMPAGEHPLALAISRENWQQQMTPDLKSRLENMLKKIIPARIQSSTSHPLVIVDEEVYSGGFPHIAPELVKHITILKSSANSYTLGKDDILLIATSQHMPGYAHLWYGLAAVLLTFALTIFGQHEKTVILYFSICLYIRKMIIRWRWKK